MVVQLTPELEELVREKLESGRYRNGDAVVAEALRLLDERDRRAALEAALDEGEDPRPVGARFRAEDARVAAPVRAHEVVLRRLVECRHECDGIVDETHHVREGVAEEARDAQRHVDTRPAELPERHQLQPLDPA